MVFTTCMAYGCNSTSYKNKELRFFQLPLTEERRHLWMQACKRQDLVGENERTLKHKYVCSLHFEQYMYSNKNLKKTATPTLNLQNAVVFSVQTQTTTAPKTVIVRHLRNQATQATLETNSIMLATEKEHPTTSYIDLSCQTKRTLTDHTPKKRHLRKTLKHSIKKKRNVERKNESLSKYITRDQFFRGCDKFLNPQMSTIVKAQVNLKRKCSGNRYTLDFKLFCLNLYQSSPNAYKFLSKTLLLPSKNTFYKMYIPMTTKLSQNMFDILTASIKHKSDFERECVICMDKMSLKCSLVYDTKQDRIVGLHEINGKQDPYAAGYAFTIMLRGIASKWKQLIGFSFISTSKMNNDLEVWLADTIKQLFEIGFKIRGIISDLGSDFLLLAKKNGISKEKSFFHIDGIKLYYIFDVPHIIKCVRNTLIKYNFHFNGKTARWDDIVMLYNLDKKRDIRLVPRLTEAHLCPNNFQKQKLRFSIQVFSNAVAAALKTYTASQEMKPCHGTIEFIQIMNDVFDLLNSNNLNSSKPYNKPYKGDDFQLKLIIKAREILLNLKVINKITGKDVTNIVKFVDAFIITINSLLQLFEDLKKDKLQYLMTQRINNDALQSFFGMIRQAGGNCREPTCIQFIRAFRKCFLFQLIKISEHANCLEDFDKIMVNYNLFCKTQSPYIANSSQHQNQQSSEIKTIDFEDPEKNAFIYMCGYMFRRIVEKHNCFSIIEYASSYTNEPTLGNICNQHTYSKKKAVLMPPNNFVNYCQNLESEFRHSFSSCIGENVGLRLRNNLELVNFETPCQCFPKKKIISLFVRMRIHYYVRFHNRQLRVSKSNKSRKYLAVADSCIYKNGS